MKRTTDGHERAKQRRPGAPVANGDEKTWQRVQKRIGTRAGLPHKASAACTLDESDVAKEALKSFVWALARAAAIEDYHRRKPRGPRAS